MVPAKVLAIRWSTGDPGALAVRLDGFGFDVDRDGVLALPSATIRIGSAGAGGPDRLEVEEEDGTAADAVRRHPNGIDDLVAIGWATVDRERFLADLAAASTEDLARDPHLGAFVVRHRASGPRPLVLILEPDTEGRLAASLARSGEGPVAIYLSTHDGLEAFIADARRRGAQFSSIRPGPLGPSVVLLGGPMWGPHLLVVDRPSGGTIAT
jgi:hypothetical protein